MRGAWQGGDAMRGWELELCSSLMGRDDEAAPATSSRAHQDVVERIPFLMLALQLPPAPLFKDALEKIVIPQVSGAPRGGVMGGRGA